MDELQKVTEEKKSTEAVEDWRYQALVDYRALGGLITDDNGIHKMTVDQLASQLGTVRKVLYDWQKRIPDFWDRVNDRRKEIGTTARLSRVHETWYLRAVKGDYQHMQLWLANFDPDFRMPAQEVKHEVGNSWAALLENRAKRPAQIVEGEVVDADATPTN